MILRHLAWLGATFPEPAPIVLGYPLSSHKTRLKTSSSRLFLCRYSHRQRAALAAGLFLLTAPDAAWAACTTSGNTVTCAPGTVQTTRIGNGDPSDNTTVNVQPNAQISVGNDNAISLGDNASITLGTNSTVTNNAGGSSGNGRWNAGPNTIEFGSNGQLTIGTGATVSALGTSNNGEPINVMGTGNVITNFGTVTSRSGAAIWFEDRTVGAGNTVDNYGVIETQLGANANVIGNQGTSNVTFINRTGATVRGSLSFAGGNDTLTLETGSVITGSFNGGGGTNTLSLSGAGNDSLAGDIRNFQTLTKDGTGRWTLTGAIGANGGNAALQVQVNQGTLALTGNNANFNGRVTVNAAGTLEARAQSLPPSIIDNGLVRFVQDTAGTYSGVVSGTGAVEKTLGGDLTLAGTNSYSGGTTINSGIVHVSSDANLGAATGGLVLNGGTLDATANITTARATTLGPLGGGLSAASGVTLTHNGAIGGAGLLAKSGAGTVVLTGSNSYAGGTVINAGTLQVSSDANLGAAGGALAFDGGTLRTSATMSTARNTIVSANGGTYETAAGTTFTNASSISGPGGITKTGAGTMLLTGTSSYTGGTRVAAGTIEIASDAALGNPAGLLTLDGGTLRISQSVTATRNTVMGPAGGTLEIAPGAEVTYSGAITGSGSATKTGAGTLYLTGTSSYTGGSTIAAGSIFINGNLSGATGTMTVQNGARLSGSGTYGGAVVVNDGARLTAGAVSGAPGTLTMGSLTLNPSSNLFLNIVDTTVGGALNDLINVNGNLMLDGRVDVLDQGQNLGPGVYRIINYTGALTNNGLDIGSYALIDGTVTRPLTGFSVQTVVPGQINLINTTGLSLNYWDGSAAANKNDNVIEGGDGIWFHAGPDALGSWTDPAGAVNAPWNDGQFAIFIGAPGTVTASNADGQITASGMQFGVGGYLLQGDPLLLVGSSDTPGVSTIRVGDGTSAGAGMTATISAALTGSTLLRKTDAGTLILSGANTYAGGTRIEGGTVQIASDAALGAAGTGITLDGGRLSTTTDIATGRAAVLNAGGGTFDTAAGTTLTLGTAVTGPGALTHAGTGNLTLLADSSYSGGTIIAAGTLQLGNGGTAGGIVGPIVDNGALVVNRSNQLVLDSAISGTGVLLQAGTGTTVLAADNSYSGATTISAGTLQLGNGGTAGTVAGPIIDNATLAINHANDFTLASAISGSGAVVHSGSGRTILTGTNSYTGTTTVASGRLYIDGNQGGATGAAEALSGTRLGGSGTVGGDVTIRNGATLSPGSDSLIPGTLTINGDLLLEPNATLLYNITSTVVGGAGNDLTVVGGDLTLGGTINVVDEGQNLGPGVYRIFNYGGSLINPTGLTIGGYSTDGTTITRPLTDFIVQTVIPNQVNLINVSGADLNYWDGSPIANKNNNLIEGGDGTWFNAGPDSTNAWTDPAGAVNAPWADDQFAIFLGAPGTVTASNADGQIRASGMQFGVDGYLLQGDPIQLLTSAGEATIRVGDGTAAGIAMTATFSAPLIGDATLIKTDAGTLVLTGVNTYTGGTRIEGGVIQIATDTALGTPDSQLTLDGGTLRMTASLSKTRPITMGPNGGTFDTVTGTTTTIHSGVDGTGSLGKAGDGTLVLVNDNTYTGGTLISAGTLQIGDGGTTGHIVGDIVDNATLVINRSNTKLTPGVISGTGQLIQAGTGTTILEANNTYTGGTIISAGTLQIGNGGTTGHVIGNIVDNATLVINRSDTKLTPAVISGTGRLIQAGTGTTVLQSDNTYTGGTIISAGTLQLGDGGTAGSVVGDILDNGVLTFNRSDEYSYDGVISGTGAIVQDGPGKTILVQNSFHTGGTIVRQGTLQFGNGTGTGGVVGDVLNDGTVITDWTQPVFYAGSVSGTGNVILNTTNIAILTGTHTFTGGTTLNGGRVELGFIGTVALPGGTYTSDGTSGSFVGDVVNNTANGLAVNRSDSLLVTGVISGTGSFEQMGPGTTIFEANNTYTGGTLISQGTLQIGNGGTTGLVPGNVVDNGRLVINRSNTKVLEGVVSGTGEVVQAGLGTLIINNTNSYSGGTAVESGVLQISRDDNLGAAVGGLRLSNGTLRTTADMTTARTTVIAQGGGTIETADGTTLTHNGVLEGAGALTKTGGGLLILSGDNSYAGPTDVAAGTLWVYGDQSAATGPTSVEAGATLGGIGTVGGDVTIADGAVLAPGDTPGTLTIAGDLFLGAGSILEYEFGEANVAGSALNDLTVVGGNLVLDGTINVTVPAGGTFDPGVYRVFNYVGALTDNGLTVGLIPTSGYYVQTSVPGQVNLINTSGLTLNYWDGAAGIRNDGVISGGDGLWQAANGNDNWTTASGIPNAPFTDAAFAVFTGAPGTVTVDDTLGAINVSGMQFAIGGYLVEGDPINLVGTSAIVRVGDLSAASAGMTATIASQLTGDAALAKTDLGTLILTGANTYTGGTQLNGGVLQIASDTALGDTSGGVSFTGGTLRTTADITTGRALTLAAAGTIDTAAGTTLGVTSAISGPGSLTKAGAGTLLLTADNGYTGGTAIAGGTLQLGNGGTTGSISGNIADNGALVVNRSNALTLAGTISGTGSLTQAGPGTTTLTADNSYTGGTTISAGTLQLGNGGTTGSIVGNIADDGALIVNRSNALALAGTISGTGTLTQAGPGTTTLTANNTYTGGTTIAAGTLQLGNGGTSGSIVGDVADNGILSFDRSNALTFAGAISGTGAVVQAGSGATTLTAANSYTGTTTVLDGALYVMGDQSAATGATSVGPATLGGTGTIGGDVAVADGVLAPGAAGTAPGTLTINGGLALSPDATLAYNFGQANVVGGPFNDLTVVGDNLALDGTLNVELSPGGSFDPGVYRIISYGGDLTNGGLELGTLPAGDFAVQTAIAQQVNLVNATGVTLNFWDGTAGPKNDGVVSGGDGVWQNAGTSDNWTSTSGTPNAAWTPAAFAVFSAAPGTVTIDNGNGEVQASGMQFTTTGYLLQGGTLTLVGSTASPDAAVVRVGDGSSLGSDYVATVDAVLAGSVALAKTDLGTLVLNGANTYSGGTRVTGGTLQVAQDANLGAAAGGLALNGGTLRTTASFTSGRATTLGESGGIFDTASGTAFTLNGVVGGPGQLIKVGEGMLVLGGSNAYAGGTAIAAGTVQISADTNLGAAAAPVEFIGGTLRTSANLASGRTFAFTGSGTLLTDADTTFTLSGAVTGAGLFTKSGPGTLVLSGDSSAYAGSGQVTAGTLAVDGALGGLLVVQPGGRLEGIGQVGNLANAGIVGPGRGGIGTLSVAGDYTGAGGLLEIEAVLGDDTSPADRLAVLGSTAGNTRVEILNRDGIGAQTVEGIKIVDVTGASNGVFTLQGDYMFEGQPAVIAGAYGYRLYKNGVATPTDGDWYLRSSLLNPPPGGGGTPPVSPPLYQPGVPVYETYPQVLQDMNGLPTLQQRVGNRAWAGDPTQGSGLWTRLEGSHSEPDPAFSTALAQRQVDQWQAQAGADLTLLESDDGSALVVGVAGQYGKADAHITSVYGNGRIEAEGYGASASVTWYGAGGLYVDGQAKLAWYKSDLTSAALGLLAQDNDGTGKAFSLEAGYRLPVGTGVTVTPQAQVIYSTVDFDAFADPAGAAVSRAAGESLKTRFGLSVDSQRAIDETRRSHVYGIANVIYEWRDGTEVEVSGTPLAHRDHRLWGELGAGGSYSWNSDRFTLYGELSANTPLGAFAEGYNLKGTVGLRIGF